MGRGIKNFAIWFLGSSPYLILWAVVIVVAVFVLRTVGKKKRMKKTFQNIKPENISDSEEK